MRKESRTDEQGRNFMHFEEYMQANEEAIRYREYYEEISFPDDL